MMDCCTIANTCVISFVASAGGMITAGLAYWKAHNVEQRVK